MTMTSQHENANGIYFLTRHKVTRIYQVVEKRFAGSNKVNYMLSTGKNIKGDFSTMEKAVREAISRQSFIDTKAA